MGPGPIFRSGSSTPGVAAGGKFPSRGDLSPAPAPFAAGATALANPSTIRGLP
jgi:hypothetical protein